MKRLISTWVIYLAGVTNGAKIACMMLALFSLLGYVFESVLEESLWGSRGQKLTLAVFGAGLLLAILLPNKETIYAMLGASLLTPENVGAVRGFSVDTIEQIAEAVASGIEKGTNK